MSLSVTTKRTMLFHNYQHKGTYMKNRTLNAKFILDMKKNYVDKVMAQIKEQPEAGYHIIHKKGYHDDGHAFAYAIDHIVFRTREEAITWLKENSENPRSYSVRKYQRIPQNAIYVNAEGEYLNGEGSVSCMMTEYDLNEAHDKLQSLLQGRPDIHLDCPVLLYESERDLIDYNPDNWENRNTQVLVQAINSEFIFSENEKYELNRVVDLDDLETLADAVRRQTR